MAWYRGNTHTHTTNSDGDAPLEQVVAWYRDHDYRFLVITDHNMYTGTGAYAGQSEMLVLPGNELSLSSEGKPVHLCGLNYPHGGRPANGATRVETMQIGVDTINQGGGVAVINHPNFRWAFTDAEMAQVRGRWLLEVINGSTDCNDWGGGGSPSTEQMWDGLLRRGMRVYGLASDDAHNYHTRYGHVSPPGVGWICVRADELTADALMQAISAGDFYFSTEVELVNYSGTPQEIALEIAQHYEYRYTTQFFGQSGLLAEAYGTEVRYTPRSNEGYVRARVCSSNGGYAWTQPVFLGE